MLSPINSPLSEQIKTLRERITAQFLQHATSTFSHRPFSLVDLLASYTHSIDALVIQLWQDLEANDIPMCLLATGGYGRKELFPYTDCDLAILLSAPLTTSQKEKIETFITTLWDSGLKVHSTVRTLVEAISQSQQDHASYSSLLENRFLWGDKALYERLMHGLQDDTLFPFTRFIAQKLTEQQKRHQYYHKTTHHLEPDIKNGPGGLRDFHILQWISLRRFHTYDLVNLPYITEVEYANLEQARVFLMTVRFALHYFTHRAEDRLLFDFQPQLADFFAMTGDTTNQKVEAFMRQFFQNCHMISVFNDVILSLLQQKKMSAPPLAGRETLDEHFFIYQKNLYLKENATFAQTPTLILKAWDWYAHYPDKITDIAPDNLHALWLASSALAPFDTHSLAVNRLFLHILQSERVYSTLALMSRYGTLGYYLPAFAQITCKMQYDLFHVYTVDTHTLLVIRNLEKFTQNHSAPEFPLCLSLIRQIPQLELLYLAALFHDIGKGGTESHSVIGAKLIRRFGTSLGLSEKNLTLIEWLVAEHLLLSQTAQHQDLNDPQVIQQFATKVQTVSRLNHLYLLTVADIHATNEKLWNNWRASLLEALYIKTLRWLQDETRQADTMSFPSPDLPCFSPKEEALPLVQIQQHHLKSATEIQIYSHYDEKLFCRIACLLDNLRFTIVEANIPAPSGETFCLSTYVILEHDYAPITRADRIARLQARLEEVVAHPLAPLPLSQGWRKRQPKTIRFATQVAFEDLPEKNLSQMRLLTRDRPGLLAQIGKIFLKQKVHLQRAKISTLGERVEDIFYLQDVKTQEALMPDKKKDLSQALCTVLDFLNDKF